jgi:hypothetical protein
MSAYARLSGATIIALRSQPNSECDVEVPDAAQCGDQWDGATLTPGAERRVAEINAECRARIFAVPEIRTLEKQNTLKARWIELTSKAGTEDLEALRLTAAERTELLRIRAIWQFVKDTVAESNRLSSDPAATPAWPPQP